jgi:hypothetical protein
MNRFPESDTAMQRTRKKITDRVAVRGPKAALIGILDADVADEGQHGWWDDEVVKDNLEL